jgi:hypothetical protein
MSTCPLCKLEVEEKDSSGETHQYRCKRCGNFQVSGSVKAMLGHLDENDRHRALLSHAIRQMQRGTDWPLLTSESYHQLLKQSSLPKPAEQANNLLLWLGQTADASEALVTVDCEALQAIIGGQRVESTYYVANYLRDQGLIWYDRVDTSKPTSPLRLQMKFDGWQQFEKLNNESVQSRTAFMAMKFGDEELDRVVEEVFRPAVAATGFQLQVLTDAPRAGLIDDRLRVEIRRSRFLIADITHQNLGAYWEAGFAEGLGKPVIYTCKKETFDSGASHFDTNHHLTVKWHADVTIVAEELKAIIRATLPAEAKLDD